MIPAHEMANPSLLSHLAHPARAGHAQVEGVLRWHRGVVLRVVIVQYGSPALVAGINPGLFDS